MSLGETTLVSSCVSGLPNIGVGHWPSPNGDLNTAVRDLEQTNVHEDAVLN